MSYRIRKVDATQKEITEALRKLGFSVMIMSDLGHGKPDIAVAMEQDKGRILFFEIKDGKKPPSKQKLNELEEKFRQSWKGHYAIVNSIESALEEINKYR